MPAQFVSLNTTTSAAPGLGSIGVEACPTAMETRFRGSAKIDALASYVCEVGRCFVVGWALGGI
jgi:hypothetical protein